MSDEVLKIIYDKNDIEYLKLYLYLYENHIKNVNSENIKTITNDTKININKINDIVKFYINNNIFPKQFTSNLSNEKYNKNIDNSSKNVIYISNYCSEKFNSDIDFQYFFKNRLNQYDYDIEVYKYIIDYCSSDSKFKNINFINWVLKDIKEKEIKNITDLKSYITSSPLYNKNISTNKKPYKNDRESYNKMFVEEVLKRQQLKQGV